ncbi:MAG: hypothetical protein VZR09_10250 [Candidatus Gastranaerophilaceae bacterium]|nr:hypothetical protein [Candidatus Gastranaerophilaceae bacterium]
MEKTTMTKVQKFQALLDYFVENPTDLGFSIEDFINHEVELIQNKASKKSGKSKEDKAKDEEMRTKILEVLATAKDENGMTASQIAVALDSSPQKITYLMGGFAETQVTKQKIKKSNYYKLA